MIGLTLPGLGKRGESSEERARRRIVFVGNPNCGKTTLFNRLTGMRAKTANFPGTTLELRRARRKIRKTEIEYIDLPGLYGLEEGSPEESMAADYLREAADDPGIPVLVVLVVDATRLTRNLCLVSEVRELTGSVVVALNMSDLATRQGLEFDTDALETELGCPVFRLSARTGQGVEELQSMVSDWIRMESWTHSAEIPPCVACARCGGCPLRGRFQWAESVGTRVCRQSRDSQKVSAWAERIDIWMTRPVSGMLIFIAVMALLFQALFSLAEVPMGWIDQGFAALRAWVETTLPAGHLNSFVVEGLLTGVAGALIFLPQICILFFLISLLEDTGYLARAAFVADRWMTKVGMPGKAFVPILSAHACAIPALMSVRSIESPRDRLVTILVLPLFTCSARIPVYVMVTAMLFPYSPFKAGLVFTGAYFLGMAAAFLTAFLLKGSLLKGEASPLMIELPGFKFPSLGTALLTMLDRGWLFLKRAGTVIAAVIALLWCLTQFPALPPDLAGEAGALDQARASQAGPHGGSEGETSLYSDGVVSSPTIQTLDETAENSLARERLEHSLIGRIGKAIQPVFAPLGFDWKITVGVLTSFAAREVVASTLSVLYGLGEDGAEAPESIAERLRSNISPAAGLSLLVFFVLAMQCLPTQVVTKRETGSWKWALFQLAHMSILAYSAAFLTHWIASGLFGI